MNSTSLVPRPPFAGSRPSLGAILGITLLALLAGLAAGVAVGLDLSLSLIVLGLAAPFILLATFRWPHVAVLSYVVLVYADLLSILVRYHGMPPLARFAGFVLLVAVVSRRVAGGQRLVADRMTWWLVAYGVVLALGLLYADAPNLVMVELVEFVRNFLTYLLIINALTSLARVRGALWLLLAMGTLLAALTVFQTVTGNFDMAFGGLAQSR